MTREEFDALILRYEKISRERPRLYLARIVGLVILAYGYLLLVLLGTLALSLLMVVMVFAAPATIKLALLGPSSSAACSWPCCAGCRCASSRPAAGP